jgi:hypothetical protein
VSDDPRTLADRLAADLAHMTAKAANARSDADALAARLALWQSNTEGAIADAGDLPGDLTAWSAFRRLTAERDELAARLSALTDAIEAMFGVVDSEAMFGVVDSEYQPTIFLRPVPTSQMERVPDAVTAVLAAAVQPPDPTRTNQQGECND